MATMLEEREEKLRVVLDPVACSRPLSAYSVEDVEAHYGILHAGSGFSSGLGACSYDGAAPRKPTHFADPYLYPTLSPREKDRLKRFYLLTEGVERDDELLAHLQELVSLLQGLGGYEIVNLGFSDLDDYVQVVAEGMKTVNVPRREVSAFVRVESGDRMLLNHGILSLWCSRFARIPFFCLPGYASLHSKYDLGKAE